MTAYGTILMPSHMLCFDCHVIFTNCQKLRIMRLGCPQHIMLTSKYCEKHVSVVQIWTHRQDSCFVSPFFFLNKGKYNTHFSAGVTHPMIGNKL